MFTGIIEETGIVQSYTANEILISWDKILEGTKTGDSISVNGICLTVTGNKNHEAGFHISEITRNISVFKKNRIRKGEVVNLERALTPASRIGGHFVTGHIDGIAEIINIEKKGQDRLYEILCPVESRKLLVSKGSVAIDGISLTVCDILSSSFIITVIPQTYNETNLKYKIVHDHVNLEMDMFAKYIHHFIAKNIRG